MRWFKLIFFGAIAIGAFYFLNFRQNVQGQQIPPLGPFLDPFAGFWQNGTTLDKLPTSLNLPNLNRPVTVVWDQRRVPHIFAETTHDLYFAQGYITARDRLWQMEFLTHFAAGRLAEIVGEQALELDRFRRRIGLAYAAEQAMAAHTADAEMNQIVDAYAAGVNAYIDGLERKALPLEYKVLDYRPERWTALKGFLLLKYMSWNLTGRSEERTLTRSQQAFGDSLIARLYPKFAPFLEPVIPRGHRWDFTPQKAIMPERIMPSTAAIPPELYDEPAAWLGSNNWAVAGGKTRNGYPIVANDPHLGLNVPAIWYEIQLSGPEVNVYGVSLPGTPAVLIGFNEQIAWGVTNAASDVLDWYQVQFQDNTLDAYLYDGEWRPTSKRVERIGVRGKETVIDTVIYTHHGPVVHMPPGEATSQVPPGTAMRWAAHDPSKELLTFLQLNAAKNYDDYVAALANYTCPAQNFIFGSVDGDIALWHNGKFPLRWDGQGRYIADGRDSRHDWQGWVPHEHNPHIKNPPRGYISSANQHPADSGYPYYLGWNYASFARGLRINERLDEMEAITPEDMLRLQLDNVNVYARTALPALIRRLEAQSLTDGEQRVLQELKSWNYENRAMWAAPLIYERWWDTLYQLIWEDDIARSDGNLHFPRTDVTLDLILNEPANPFFDIATTEKKETLDDLVFQSFRKAKESLENELGPISEKWAWGKARGTDIRHLAQIPGLGCLNLFTSGNHSIVNATNKYAGPSWRMVVELGPQVRGWGIYPGGQSGNPGSIYYDNMVQPWVAGEWEPLLFLRSANDALPQQIAGIAVLQ